MRFGREGYKAINQAMYDVMTLLRKVRVMHPVGSEVDTATTR